MKPKDFKYYAISTLNTEGANHAPFGHKDKRKRKYARKFWRYCCNDYAPAKLKLYRPWDNEYDPPRRAEKTDVGFKIYGRFYYSYNQQDWGWLCYIDGKPAAFYSTSFGMMMPLHGDDLCNLVKARFFRECEMPTTQAQGFDKFYHEMLGMDALVEYGRVYIHDRQEDDTDFWREIDKWHDRHLTEIIDRRWEKLQNAKAIRRENQSAEGSMRQLRALGFVA